MQRTAHTQHQRGAEAATDSDAHNTRADADAASTEDGGSDPAPALSCASASASHSGSSRASDGSASEEHSSNSAIGLAQSTTLSVGDAQRAQGAAAAAQQWTAQQQQQQGEWELEGGLVVHRAILCRCPRSIPTPSPAPTAANQIAGSSTTSSTPSTPCETQQPQHPSRPSDDDSLSSLITSQVASPELAVAVVRWSETASRIQLVSGSGSEERGDGAAAAAAAALQGHTAQCARVLLKSGVTDHAAHFSFDRLRYETLIQRKLAAAYAAAHPTATPALVLPHLRELSDSRLALVLPDKGGVTLLQHMHAAKARVPRLFVPTTPSESSKAPKQATPPPPTSLVVVWEALRAVTAVAEQLQLLHSCGLVHKSLCPLSVLYSPASSQVTFLDLSIASSLIVDRAGADLNVSLHAPRSWLWAAPEQSGKANRQIDARSDLYSLGCVMHQLLTGKPPFGGSPSSSTSSARLATSTSSTALARLQRAGALAQGTSGSSPSSAAAAASSSSHLAHSHGHHAHAHGAALDPLELIWLHLAKAPPSIIPASVTAASQPELHCALKAAQAIAEKLMQKQAEDRYQSAGGLLHDLRIVLAALNVALHCTSSSEQGSPLIAALASFQPGRLDRVSTYRLSQKLYGREPQVAQLRGEYARLLTAQRTGVDQIAAGPGPWQMAGPRLFLLSGYSGVGKTSLVDELHQHLLSARGLFARGKFDLYKRDSTCFLSAFRSLCVQLLVQDAATWKVKLLRALGSLGAVLCDVLPELERLIGPQPAVAKIGPAEAAARFNFVFLQFVGCLSTAPQPLVLFLDDCQWMDGGSLSLLRLLLSHEPATLLIICAYRDNEVDEAHPLAKMIVEVKAEHGSRVAEVLLQPLTSSHISELLVDSFRVSAAAAAPLAQLLLARTQGNPFHLSQLLASYHSSKLLWFDFGAGEWRWNLEVLQKQAVHADVVDLVCRHMLMLSAAAQQLLQYAACSGNRFTLHALQLVTQMSLQQLSQCAAELEQAGMLLCTSNAQDLLLLTSLQAPPDHSATPIAASSSPAEPLASGPATRLASIQLQFAHDKIQAAAYKLIPAGEVSRVHCTIATQLLKSYDEAEIEEYAIDIAGHINTGWLQTSQRCGSPSLAGDDVATSAPLSSSSSSPSPIAQPSWSAFFREPGVVARVIELEIMAGKQAKASAAYDSALHFFAAALRLVQDSHAASSVDAAVEAADPAAAAFLRVSDACWLSSSCFPALVTLYFETASCLFLLNRCVDCCECVDFALQHIQPIEQRCGFFELNIVALTWRRLLQEAMDQGLLYLSELGVELLSEPSPELLDFIFAPGLVDLDDEATYTRHPLFSMNELTSTVELAAVTVLGAVSPLMYLLGSPQFYPLILTMISYCRDRQGVSSGLGFALGLLGICLCKSDQYTEAYALARIGALFLDASGESGRLQLPRFNVSWVTTFPWKRPLAECASRLEATSDEGLLIGDLEWAGYLSMYSCDMISHAQVPLSQAIPRQQYRYNLLKHKGMQLPTEFASIWLEFSLDLSGAQLAPAKHESPLPLLAAQVALTAAWKHILLRRPEEAVVVLEAMEPLLTTLASLQVNQLYAFLLALSLIDSCPKCTLAPYTLLMTANDEPSSSHTMIFADNYSAARVIHTLERVDSLIARMKTWATHCPANYLHRLHLMQAERSRLAIFSHLACIHLILPSMQLYEAAVDAAHRNGFPLDEALSIEYSARYMVHVQRFSSSRSAFLRAYTAYRVFGAGLKLKQLQAEFVDIPFPIAADAKLPVLERAAPQNASANELSASATQSPLEATADSLSTGSTPHQKPLPPPSLDAGIDAPTRNRSMPVVPVDDAETSPLEALSVLRAVASFSVEKDQSKLLKRLMRIVLETAGATRGVLVLENTDKEWCVELGGSVELLEESSELRPSPPRKVIPQQPAVPAPVEPGHAHTDSSSTQRTGSLDCTSPDASEDSSQCGVGNASQDGAGSLESALPSSVFSFVLSSVEPLLISDPHKQTDVAFAAFSSDPYFQQHQPRALLCMPVLRAGSVFGVLYLENDFRSSAFTSSHIQLLQLLCGQAALSIDNARLYSALSANNASLEQQVHTRTAELEEKNRQLNVAKEAAEAATRIKSDFLSNMSHEIRTPMNAVVGIGRLLADTSLTLEQQQYVQMINNSGHLLLTIINDILDFSKIEAGQLAFNYSHHNVADIAETSAMLCYDMAVSKGLTMSWWVDASLPPSLLIDSTRLQQILLNLISNAIKFTRKGGVALSVGGRPLADEEPASSKPANAKFLVEISVKDTGIGISPAQLTKLFRSFSQVQHVSGEFGGTGLGLVISKRLVEAMGGEVRVVSEAGRGSDFTIYLPCGIGAHPASPTLKPQLATPAGSLPPSPPRVVLDSGPPPPSVPSSRQSSTEEAHPSVSLNIHNLAPSEIDALGRTSILFIGERDPVTDAWIRTVEQYGASVEVKPNIVQAKQALQSCLPAPSVTAAGSAKISHPYRLIVLDLDSSSASNSALSFDEAAADLKIDGAPPLRVLSLYSKTHQEGSISPEQPTPSSSASSSSRVAIVADRLPPASLQSTMQAVASSAAATARPPSHALNIDTGAMVPLARRSSFGGQSPLVLSSSGNLIARSLRRPFKLSSLLHSLVKLHLTATSTPEFKTAEAPHLEDAWDASTSTASLSDCLPATLQSHIISSQLTRSSNLDAESKSADNGSTGASNGLGGGDVASASSAGSGAGSSMEAGSDAKPKSPPGSTAARSLPVSRTNRITPIAPSHPLRILLAEDNLINVKMMVMLLRKLGYEILVAYNGREALDILDREAAKGAGFEIQTILMDASMDVMDGMECTRVIRAQQLPSRTRPFIIAQTANVTDQYRTMCLESGMDLFLSKPVQVESLASSLQAAHAWHQVQLQQQQQVAQQPIAAAAAAAVSASLVAAPSVPASASSSPTSASSAPPPVGVLSPGSSDQLASIFNDVMWQA